MRGTIGQCMPAAALYICHQPWTPRDEDWRQVSQPNINDNKAITDSL